MVFHNGYCQGILLHPLLLHGAVFNMPGIDRHWVRAQSFPAFTLPFLLPWPIGQGASSCVVLPRVIPAGVGSHGEQGLHLAAKRTAWALFPTGQIQTAQQIHRKKFSQENGAVKLQKKTEAFFWADSLAIPNQYALKFLKTSSKNCTTVITICILWKKTKPKPKPLYLVERQQQCGLVVSC